MDGVGPVRSHPSRGVVIKPSDVEWRCYDDRVRQLAIVIVLLAVGLSSPIGEASDSNACTCAEARRINGRCEFHGIGYVAEIPIHSALLHETLDAHGHQVDPDTFECEACRKAIATDGFCEKDRIGFIGGLAYFSRLTYELARGEWMPPGALSCPICRKNAEDGPGWCDQCERGMVGHTAIRDREAYEATAKAVAILRAAIEMTERCEHCAVAMVTDTDCPYHRIFYKDGDPVP